MAHTVTISRLPVVPACDRNRLYRENRRAAARERATAAIARDNARIAYMYEDEHALRKGNVRLKDGHAEYPDFDFKWGRVS